MLLPLSRLGKLGRDERCSLLLTKEKVFITSTRPVLHLLDEFPDLDDFFRNWQKT